MPSDAWVVNAEAALTTLAGVASRCEPIATALRDLIASHVERLGPPAVTAAARVETPAVLLEALTVAAAVR